MNATCFENYEHMFPQYFGKWRGRIYSMDVETPLALDMSACGITFQKSMVSDPKAGLGLFVSRTLGKGAVVWYYSGSLVYKT